MSRTLKRGLLALSGTTGVALIAVTPALAGCSGELGGVLRAHKPNRILRQPNGERGSGPRRARVC